MVIPLLLQAASSLASPLVTGASLYGLNKLMGDSKPNIPKSKGKDLLSYIGKTPLANTGVSGLPMLLDLYNDLSRVKNMKSIADDRTRDFLWSRGNADKGVSQAIRNQYQKTTPSYVNTAINSMVKGLPSALGRYGDMERFSNEYENSNKKFMQGTRDFLQGTYDTAKDTTRSVLKPLAKHNVETYKKFMQPKGNKL